MVTNHRTRNSCRRICCTVLVLMLVGCGSGASPDAIPQPEALHGIWERKNYGDVLVVDENGAQLYQYTQTGCLSADFLSNGELAEIFNEVQLSADRMTLTSVPSDDPVFPLRLERLAVLPQTCTGNSLIVATTPTASFEHLWQTFADYYAFFGERGVDWQAQYAELRPAMDDDATDEELIALLTVLLEPLDDGHVQLNIDGDVIDFANFRGANRVIVETFPLQTEYNDIQQYADALSRTYKEIRASYLDPGSAKSVDGAKPDRFLWGTIGQEVGYLRIASMTDLTVSGDGSDVRENLAAVDRIMPDVLADLQNTNAMIVDVRINSGGEDAVSLAIASYFADQRRLAISKRARSYLGETTEFDVYIEPANSTPYLNPIAVIGAPDTASAAEVFLMAMNALPHVTLVGENSNGVLSDTLIKTLPNGWEIGLSNEVYSDYLGVNYEVIGVPPDVPAETFSLEAMAQDRDAAIDAALTSLGYPALSREN